MKGSGYFHIDGGYDARGRYHETQSWEPGWEPDQNPRCQNPHHCSSFVDGAGHPLHACSCDYCNGVPVNNHNCDEQPKPGLKNVKWHVGLPCPCGWTEKRLEKRPE